jgi:hypothetical protein
MTIPGSHLFYFAFTSGSLALTSALADTVWQDTPGKHSDLIIDGKKVARYVYEPIDTSSKERREATYKPFHHVYDAAGDGFLTKGPGGQFTHHRGIYYGFSKCRYTGADGSTHQVDTWHCKGDTHQSHERFLAQAADDNAGSHTVAIDWHGDGGEVFASEERTLRFAPGDDGLVVDFVSTLSTSLPQVVLDGDPQHAGFQFRASNEVSAKTKDLTYYLRHDGTKGGPGATLNWPGDASQKDLPWKAMSFVVAGERYTTLYLDHPDNPKPSMYSERNYGRFGSYFVARVTPGFPLTVRYRLVVVEGELDHGRAEEHRKAFLAAFPAS